MAEVKTMLWLMDTFATAEQEKQHLTLSPLLFHTSTVERCSLVGSVLLKVTRFACLGTTTGIVLLGKTQKRCLIEAANGLVAAR